VKRFLWLPAVLAVALYLPAVRYAFVQDDRAIVVANPAAHSVGAALRAFDDPYWPAESGAGLYRPLTIVTYGLDWVVSGGRPWWFHLMNALWHGLATLLVTLVLARWVPPLGALAGGLVFAAHPVHVEAVANIVSRAQLLAACAMFGAVLLARRRNWVLAVLLAAAAMFAKEHGVVVGGLILLDDWLDGGPRYPKAFYGALGALTIGYLLVWLNVGSQGAGDVAAPFLGASTMQRLALALPAVARATLLLVLPFDLSADYSPQVIAVRSGFSAAAVIGVLVVLGALVLVVWGRRRAPALAFGAGVAAVTYLPTSNLLLPSGIVLAERSLYEAVALVAAAAAVAGVAVVRRRGSRAATVALGLVVLALSARTLARLPAWRDNRSYLLTLLIEHPESYRAHYSAAAVIAGLGDTAGARRQYDLADSLFARDPHLQGNRAFFLLSLGDSTRADSLARLARARDPRERLALRVQVALAVGRGRAAEAHRLADSAIGWHREEQDWYRIAVPSLKP
jgi:hypothetical protein